MATERARTIRATATALTIVLAACAGDREPGIDSPAAGPAPVDNAATGGTEAAQVALGDSIFKGQLAAGICYTCHGVDAKGTALAPDLTDTVWLNGDGSLAFIANTVRTGVAQPKQFAAPMPPFEQTLSADQVNAVAAYVHTLSRPG
jgi:mono/diheme cytochrome c family protein